MTHESLSLPIGDLSLPPDSPLPATYRGSQPILSPL